MHTQRLTLFGGLNLCADKKAAAEAQKKQQLEVSRDIGQFLALVHNSTL
jgi:hypothetical protein